MSPDTCCEDRRKPAVFAHPPFPLQGVTSTLGGTLASHTWSNWCTESLAEDMSRQRERETSGRKEGRKEVLSPCHSHCEVLLHEAAVAEQPSPQLHADDAEDEEDKEAEKKDVPQHGQGVQQQVHKDAHACRGEENQQEQVWDTGIERGREEGKEKERSLQDTHNKSKKPHKNKSRVSEINHCPNLAGFMVIALSCPNLYWQAASRAAVMLWSLNLRPPSAAKKKKEQDFWCHQLSDWHTFLPFPCRMMEWQRSRRGMSVQRPLYPMAPTESHPSTATASCSLWDLHG